MNTGMLYACLAYLCWGLFPLYFKSVKAVPALEILLNRMVWSMVFMSVILLIKNHWHWLRGAIHNRRIVGLSALSASTLAINWFLYIWAVNAGHVVDASLGYFINPLVNVLIGAVFLRERLRLGQWVAIAVAFIGVAWLTWQAGALPWIGLVLAVTFASYGLLRKTAALGALEGLAMETALLSPFALIALFVMAANGQNSLMEGDWTTSALLIASGPITAIPLLLFAAGARRIPFSTLGILQYIGPTGQLLLGVFLYHEPFPAIKIAGYAAIWSALFIYSLEGLWQMHRRKAVVMS
jgi:chloramphenicol-sensitive protein RarD